MKLKTTTVSLQITIQKDKYKGKKEAFLTFRKHEAVPLATCMQIYKKRDIVNIRGIDTVHKVMARPVYVTVIKLVDSSVAQHAIGIAESSELRTRLLRRE